MQKVEEIPGSDGENKNKESIIEKNEKQQQPSKRNESIFTWKSRNKRTKPSGRGSDDDDRVRRSVRAAQILLLGGWFVIDVITRRNIVIFRNWLAVTDYYAKFLFPFWKKEAEPSPQFTAVKSDTILVDIDISYVCLPSIPATWISHII